MEGLRSAAGATLGEGYVIAPLDIHENHGDEAMGTRFGSARGGPVHRAQASPCEEHEQRVVRAGRARGRPVRGGERDVLASGVGAAKTCTLIEAESLDDLSERGIELAMGATRRNVVTRGIRLNALVGQRFTIGGIPCYGARLAEPCAHLERLTTRGVLRGLVHRGGIRVDVLCDGELRVGDEIRADPAQRSGR